MLFVLALGIVSQAARGADAAPAGEAPKLSAEERAQYARWFQTEVELNTRIKLLSELTEEHLQRAEAARAVTPDKARWENDRAQELRDKSAGVLTQLNEATRQRLAFETAHKISDGTPTLGASIEAKPLGPEEQAYVRNLDERLVRIRQELVQALQAGRELHAQLQTNINPENVSRVSLLLEDNTRVARQWEREQADIELRKLEFQALRKP